MTARTARDAAPLAAALVVTLLACGDSARRECACGADPSAFIDLPPDRAVQVVEVQLGGVACASATATCTQPVASGCAQYAYQASADGTCVVDVLFAAGPPDFHAEVKFASVTCCSGFYAQPPSAAHLDVPSASGDGGAAG
jgi:hypothetical protein